MSLSILQCSKRDLSNHVKDRRNVDNSVSDVEATYEEDLIIDLCTYTQWFQFVDSNTFTYCYVSASVTYSMHVYSPLNYKVQYLSYSYDVVVNNSSVDMDVPNFGNFKTYSGFGNLYPNLECYLNSSTSFVYEFHPNIYMDKITEGYQLLIEGGLTTSSISWIDCTGSDSNMLIELPFNADIYYSLSYDDLVNIDFKEIYNKVYNNAFEVGKENGYSIGYNKGHTDGVNESNEFNLITLVKSIVRAPGELISSMFDFDFFGINMATLVKSLLTICLVVFVIYWLKGRGSNG